MSKGNHPSGDDSDTGAIAVSVPNNNAVIIEVSNENLRPRTSASQPKK